MPRRAATLHRRSFLQASAGAALAAAALRPATLRAAEKAGPASERIRVGAIGVGNRAKLLLEQLPEGAQIVALSDCNVPRAEAFKAAKQGDWPIVADYRQLLDRQDIDAVIVGTGEFQRVLPCIHALQAGKDVYAEKPLSLYVQEGRALADAVRHYGRVLQVGSQQRSMAINRLACEFVRNGGLGKLLEVRAVNYPGPAAAPEPAPAEEPVTAGLDWSMWLNQSVMRPFNKKWLGWMAWRDFSGGQMTNWGAHGVDQIQWALGADGAGPVEIWPLSEGSHGQVAMRYANDVEVKFILDRGPMGGAVFVGERGKLEINRNKVVSNPPEIAAEILKSVDVAAEEKKWSDQTALWQARAHLQDWLDCICSRKLPVADVEIGHRSITTCHLANIAREAGRRLQWDAKAEKFVGDPQADAMLVRERRAGFELPKIG
ncbi:MAG: Gfo/Idh/MocA family oxidoreductase [Planctomycetes bacterium]|nr:Gfo/Idh/MocA family oxidoreductase [Planctomycetota bacterium]